MLPCTPKNQALSVLQAEAKELRTATTTVSANEGPNKNCFGVLRLPKTDNYITKMCCWSWTVYRSKLRTSKCKLYVPSRDNNESSIQENNRWAGSGSSMFYTDGTVKWKDLPIIEILAALTFSLALWSCLH